MRAVLMDWLIEVSEEFGLFRETYYTASNLVDRYLSKCPNIRKSEIQLIGVTGLFIASKVQEVYPPSISQFADLTDGACTCKDILTQEILFMQALQWQVTPPTIPAWLDLLLPRAFNQKDVDSKFASLFCFISEILDLATLDIASICFRPKVLAVTAVTLCLGNTGSWKGGSPGVPVDEFERCLEFLFPICDLFAKVNFYENFKVPPSVIQAYSTQLHNINMGLYDKLARPEPLQFSTPPSSSVKAKAPEAPRKQRPNTRRAVEYRQRESGAGAGPGATVDAAADEDDDE